MKELLFDLEGPRRGRWFMARNDTEQSNPAGDGAVLRLQPYLPSGECNSRTVDEDEKKKDVVELF